MITILDDDQPGLLQFTQDDYTVSEVEKEAVLRVERKSGCTGRMICSYRTETISAVPGQDYVPVGEDKVEEVGKLIFKNEVTSTDEPGSQSAGFTEYTEGGTDFCVCQID